MSQARFCKNHAAPATVRENDDEWLQAPVLKRKRPIEQEAKIDCLTSRPFLPWASAWRDAQSICLFTAFAVIDPDRRAKTTVEETKR
jgi:hypothetical protein